MEAKQIRCPHTFEKINSNCNKLIGYSYKEIIFVNKNKEYDFKTLCSKCKKDIYIKFK